MKPSAGMKRIPVQSRRDVLKATLIAIPYLFLDHSRILLAAGESSRLSVEVYIWLELLARQHRPLSEALPDIFSTAKAAGFHNIELNADFFTPELSARTLSLLEANQLRTPSIYVGGAMHEAAAGAETTGPETAGPQMPGSEKTAG